LKNRWLIISYFANIDAMAPSHHIDNRLPFFKQKGIDINLITSFCGAHYKNFFHVRVPSCAPSGIRYEVRHILRRKTSKRFWFKFWEFILLLPVYPFYFIEKILLKLDSTWSWFITASIISIIVAIKNKPSIIYSTGGPVSAHIAAKVASSITKIPHIAEFQDPLVHQYAAPSKFERHFIKNVERSILKTATASVFLTQQAATNAFTRNPKSNNTAALYAGAAPLQKAPHYMKGEMFTIAHFGALGGSRNLGYFFRALDMLFTEYPDLPVHFRLDLYGNNSRNVSKQIKQFPYTATLRINGKIKWQEARKVMYTTDVLLLIQNTDDVSFETIPSKVYEYLHTGRPIFALLYRNSELRDMLESRGHTVVQADDEEGIKKGLETYIAQWKHNRLQSSASESPYTTQNAVDELIRLAQRSLNVRTS
jgi:glycosyltransferase involved in cell wall biosynthesis